MVQDAKNEQEDFSAIGMFEQLISGINGGIVICLFDPENKVGKVVCLNKGWSDITGYTIEELRRNYAGNPQAIVFSEDKEEVNRSYREQIAKGDKYELIYRVVHKNGTLIWVMDRGTAIILKDGIIQNRSIITEVTAIKKQEEFLSHLAQMDQLTEVANKATFGLMAKNVLEQYPTQLHAAIMLDIDNFKDINDGYGHACGDEALRKASQYLKKLVTSRDIVGRVGGDEFAILLVDVSNREEAEERAQQVCEAFCGFNVDTKGNPYVSASLGVAFSEDASSFDDLFVRADKALYVAKGKGKRCCAVYG
ncbi:MAG: sensor domain-containing diguanylate cyclase [Gordonibacter sp.]|nr:sensor domain-containing diguanylate cyclase [Gordonibacter sp.]